MSALSLFNRGIVFRGSWVGHRVGRLLSSTGAVAGRSAARARARPSLCGAARGAASPPAARRPPLVVSLEEVECGATGSARVRRLYPYNPGTTPPWRRRAAPSVVHQPAAFAARRPRPALAFVLALAGGARTAAPRRGTGYLLLTTLSLYYHCYNCYCCYRCYYCY